MSVIIVRKNMLAECFGAEILKKYDGASIIRTDAIVSPTTELLEQVTGKDILIVGGYYGETLEQFVSVANKVSVFYNASDDCYKGKHVDMVALDGMSFASYAYATVSLSCKKRAFFTQITSLLDEYLYGFPSEESIKFQYGIYETPRNYELEIENLFLIVDGINSIQAVIQRGSSKYEENLKIAQERVEVAKEYTVSGKRVMVAIGNSPIMHSCLLLAQATGIGMLVRYDEEKQRTFISCRVTEKSGENAGEIMKVFINGGGSRAMGGGSIDGISTLDKLFS